MSSLAKAQPLKPNPLKTTFRLKGAKYQSNTSSAHQRLNVTHSEPFSMDATFELLLKSQSSALVNYKRSRPKAAAIKQAFLEIFNLSVEVYDKKTVTLGDGSTQLVIEYKPV